MRRDRWTIVCLAYIIGLSCAPVFKLPNPHPSWQQWAMVVVGLGLSSAIAGAVVPRLWRQGPPRKLWLVAGIIAIVAIIYLQLRIPQPKNNDISHLLTKGNHTSRSISVEGKILSQGRITRTRRAQFWFEARKFKDRAVTGKVYVTVPLDAKTDLYPGRKVTLRGILYRPKSNSIPGGFDFKGYLNRQGCFVGLKATKILQVSESNESVWGLWRLRQRIASAQERWLGTNAGSLVSAIVLGRQAVDLPHALNDRFVKAGLAHVLAASGFQVSLLLGTLLALTKDFSGRVRLTIGLGGLIFYIGLTGIEPSIMRAGLMGAGTLFALVTERRIRPIGSLLLTATLLLLSNPLWIWDIGFNLSFLATLGLIVTVPAIQKRLDWLPTGIASLISIPIAASVWTLPLTCHVFNTIAIYAIAIDIITAPLILIISLVGTLSALTALILPVAGSAIASLLYYPIQLLIAIVEFCDRLPGSSIAVGKIPLISLIIIYALICSIWLNEWWQARWRTVALIAAISIVLPVWYHQSSLVQITVLAAKQEPVLILQNRGKVGLINAGEVDTARYSILPFLKQQGVNRIDRAVAVNSRAQNNSGWDEIESNIAVKDFYSSLSVGQTISIGSATIEAIAREEPFLQLQIQGRTWWLVAPNFKDKISGKLPSKSPDVFLWFGKSLNPQWLDTLKPKVAIAASKTVAKSTAKLLKQKQIQLYWTGGDGAMQWTPKEGFQRMGIGEDKNDFLM